MICNRLTVVMGGVSLRVESWGIVKPVVTIQLKVEDVCILCNVIEASL